MSEAVAQRKAGTVDAVTQLFEAKRINLQEVLPDKSRVLRITKQIVSAASRNPKLLECTNESIYTAAIKCATLNLEPGPLEEMYLVPRANRKTRSGALECNADIGFRGYITLAERHPDVLTTPEAHIVYKDEPFEYDPVAGTIHYKWMGDQVDRSDKAIRYVFVKVLLKQLGPDHPRFHVVTRAEIEKRRSRSTMKSGGAWESNYPEMCLKSALKDMAQRRKLPLSIEAQEIVHEDMLEEVEEIKAADVKVTDVEDAFDDDPPKVEPSKDKPKTKKPQGDKMGMGDPENSDDRLRKQLAALRGQRDDVDWLLMLSRALGRTVMDETTLERPDLVKAIKALSPKRETEK